MTVEEALGKLIEMGGVPGAFGSGILLVWLFLRGKEPKHDDEESEELKALKSIAAGLTAMNGKLDILLDRTSRNDKR